MAKVTWLPFERAEIVRSGEFMMLSPEESARLKKVQPQPIRLAHSHLRHLRALVARRPAGIARGICLLDVWAIRTRLEWGSHDRPHDTLRSHPALLAIRRDPGPVDQDGSAVRGDEAALGQLLSFAQRQRCIYLDELTPSLLRAAMADLMARSDQPRPANWQGGTATAITLTAAAHGLTKTLAADGIRVADLGVVKAPKLPERIQPRLTRSEFLALETAARSRAFQTRKQALLVARDLAILYLLADTGLRAAEMVALNVGDLNFEEGTLTLRRGKGAKDRILSIADTDPHELDGGLTLRTLRTYLFHREERQLTEQPALWVSPKGNRLTPNNLRDALRSLCEDAGLNGNRPPYAFRRGWFTAAYQSEPMALPILAARMGWTRADAGSMARVYTRGVDMELARTQPRPSLARRSPRSLTRSTASGSACSASTSSMSRTRWAGPYASASRRDG